MLVHLDQAATAYRAEHEQLERTRAELAAAHASLATERAELDRVREESRRQCERAEQLREILKDVHRSLFSGNLYELILKACLTLTGATRGMYLTCPGRGLPLRVRAAVGVDGYPRPAPSPYVEALCRRVLDEGETLVHNTGDRALRGLPAPETSAEEFRNFVVTTVVLLKNLDGVILVADKPTGEFEADDVEALLSVGDQAAVAVENRHLERELQSAYVSTVSMLADAVEAKDPYTHGHCEMASRFARLIARRMELPEYDRAVVCYAALLHDVGKIGVSDGVLHKPGPLLPEEVELMRAHVRVGHDLLSNVPALRAVADVVLHHHERYDGSGYPDGMRGEEIPVPARIVAVVDAYCAMITRRSYKEAFSDAEAREELQRCAGTQFDPDVVSIFLAVLDSPEATDRDDDFFADCGALPDFAHVRQLRDPADAAAR
ncbi:MAG TPA: HD domain-containing phosphohydrolase [Longimicrobiaceae bacterium]|nr:HD domain-containing phosphohydrolase [Longimicrobiaceae bacterium]